MPAPEVDVDEAARRRDDGAALLDVRRLEEWDEVRVPGAIHVPLDELVERVDEVTEVATLYVFCGSGGRSARAAEYLRTQGVDAFNVAGGIVAWQEAGHPVESGPS